MPKNLQLRKHKVPNSFDIMALNSERVIKITEYVVLPLKHGLVSLKCYITPEISSDVKVPKLTNNLQRQIHEFDMKLTQNFNNETIQLHVLCGLDQLPKILINGYFRLLNENLMTLPTIFGDCLFGTQDYSYPYSSYSVKRCFIINNNKLDYLLKRIFLHDRMHELNADTTSMSEEDLRSIKLFEENFKIYRRDPATLETDYNIEYYKNDRSTLMNDIQLILQKGVNLDPKYIIEVGLNRKINPILPKNHFETIKRAQNLFKKLQLPEYRTQKSEYMEKINDMIKRKTIKKSDIWSRYYRKLLKKVPHTFWHLMCFTIETRHLRKPG